MKKYINGEYSEMTQEEIDELNNQTVAETESEPTTEERLEALESALLEVIMNG